MSDRNTDPVHGTASSASLEASVDHCCRVARRSRSQFYLTFLALPRDLFRDMCVLYAFMRKTDDLGDDTAISLPERRIGLAGWRLQLSAALESTKCDDPVLRALADVVRRRTVPAQLLLDVIDGVESDLTPRRIETFGELENYCYHVAGAVGLCCIRVWGYSDPRAEGAAVACGTAFQLTNILRDVSEDLSTGRIYLPQEDLDRFGVTPDILATGGRNEAWQSMMRFQVDRARDYYRQAEPIMQWLSPSGRRVQRAMLHMYGSLLDEIERRGFDVQSRRVRVPRRLKWWIAARCLLGRGG